MDEEEMDQEYPVAISRNDRFEIKQSNKSASCINAAVHMIADIIE